MLAASNGRLEVVKTLIEADADMDMEDSTGQTAIMLAEKGGHKEIVEYLRKSGAEE